MDSIIHIIEYLKHINEEKEREEVVHYLVIIIKTLKENCYCANILDIETEEIINLKKFKKINYFHFNRITFNELKERNNL